MESAIDGSDEILLISLGHIEGFDYEEGYEYKLKVSISSRKNPPANGPTVQYNLIELISKEKIVSLLNLTIMRNNILYTIQFYQLRQAFERI